MTIDRHEELRRQCSAFHADHPEVWMAFEQYALEVIRAGYHHYGAKAIMERVRWQLDMSRGPDDRFKINNNYVAFYARRFERLHPQMAGFFRHREQTSKGQQAKGEAA